MANLNKVMLIGRLTRDPEMRTFANGGKVAYFGFAVNNRRKNAQTGEWEDEPVFLDISAFNRTGYGTTAPAGRQLADQVEQYMHKGNQVFIEGHLKWDQWTAQDGQKRQMVKIVMDNFQLLEPRTDGGSRESYSRPARASAPPPGPTGPMDSGGGYDESYSGGPAPEANGPPPEAGPEGDIPF